MADIQHPTEAECNGPFYLTPHHLEALDGILSDIWTTFEEDRKPKLDRAVEEEIVSTHGYPYEDKDVPERRQQIRRRLELSWVGGFQSDKKITLAFRGGSSATFPDIATAVGDPDIVEKTVNGLHAVMVSAKRECIVAVSQGYGGTPRLTVKLKPEDDRLSQEKLIILRNWIDAVRPTWWMATCWRIRWLSWPLCVFVVFGATLFVLSAYRSPADAQMIDQATQLIESGIDTSEIGQAVELLLRKSFSLPTGVPEPPPPPWPRWHLILTCGCLIYSIMLRFLPDMVIAIGQGTRTLPKWQWYSRLVAVSIPLYLFYTLIWPQIESIIWSIQ